MQNGVSILHTQNGHSRPRGGNISPLHCPMCRGELIYGEGSHDLICSRNRLDNDLSVSTERGGALIPRAADLDPPRGNSCVFAISFTESVNSAVLFSIRIDNAETDYNHLAQVMKAVQTRKRGRLARNYGEAITHRPALPTTEAKLAAKLGLSVEDLFSIQHSTETIKGLAQFYGITEGNVRTIKRSEF